MQDSDSQEKETALRRKLLEMQKYMQLVALVKQDYSDKIKEFNTQTPKEKKRNLATFQKNLRKKLREESSNSEFKKLNTATLNTLIEFSVLIPADINIIGENFETEDSIQTWLRTVNYTNLQSLDKNLINLKKKQKISQRWDKATDVFYVAAQSLTPLIQIPFLQIIIKPLVDGLWGCWYACWAISIGYDPALGKKNIAIKSRFDKASYIAGGIATVCTFLAFLFPPLLPIVVPLGACALLTSNVLWLAGAAINFYKEIKEGKQDAGRNWRIASQASSVLYIAGSIVVVALVIVALFTPVGWAAGAGAIAFGVGAAVASLAVLGISKFCKWRAEKKVEVEKEKNRELSLKSEINLNPQTTLTASQTTLTPSTTLTKPAPSEQENKSPILHGFQQTKTKLNAILSKETSINEATILLRSNTKIPLAEKRVINVPSLTRQHEQQTQDVIKCSSDKNQQTEISLTPNPSDNAIFMMLDMCRTFVPLTMDYCGNAIIALKIFEAAKLVNVNVQLNPRDVKLLTNHPDPNLQSHFNTIKSLDSSAFKKYVDKTQTMESKRPLGFVPNTIPDKQQDSFTPL